MFQIRRIHDDVLPANQAALTACGEILLTQIPTAGEGEITRIRNALRDPISGQFKALILVAERRGQVIGFSLVLQEPSLKFSYLDFICAAPGKTSGGLGSALYQRTREEARALGSKALFFEVMPDHPEWCPDKTLLKQNRARLKFYEKWGARPVIGTTWDAGIAEHAPTVGTEGCAKQYTAERPITYLCCDILGHPTTPGRTDAKKMLTALLTRRYPDDVTAASRDNISASIKTERLELRPYFYERPHASAEVPPRPGPIPMVKADGHEQHWVHDRGYYESPVRLNTIAEAVLPSGLVTLIPTKEWPDKHIRDVHDVEYVTFLEQLSKSLGKRSIYADVFPPRNRRAPPADPLVSAGWYCSDSFTPLNSGAIAAARNAVNCALTAADLIRGGYHSAYALVRPPGHHAESRMFGGYCYYNNSAIAAHYLTKHIGKVAILDIDYHHGNGQQEIFYRRSDVLTVSIHGDPVHNYPYYSGFTDETGTGTGKGYNLNIPLPSGSDAESWRNQGLIPALKCIREFNPSVLVIAAGLDTAKADPTGTFTQVADDFAKAGRLIGQAEFPTLFVQEGGYRTRTLGRNAHALLRGFAEGADLL